MEISTNCGMRSERRMRYACIKGKARSTKYQFYVAACSTKVTVLQCITYKLILQVDRFLITPPASVVKALHTIYSMS